MKIRSAVPFLFQAHGNCPTTDFMKIRSAVLFLFQTYGNCPITDFMKIRSAVPFLFQAHGNCPTTDFMKIRSAVPFLFQVHRLNSRVTEQYYEALRSVSSRLIKPAVLLSALRRIHT
jgi:hypothetical protein